MHHLDVEGRREAPCGHVVDLVGQALLAAPVLLLDEGLGLRHVGVEEVAQQAAGWLRRRDEERADRQRASGDRDGLFGAPDLEALAYQEARQAIRA